MSGLRRRRVLDIWPGFVDAIASLLMVVVFVLLMASIGHFFLSDAISGRDETLARLNQQVARLNELLGEEQARSEDLTAQLAGSETQLSETQSALSQTETARQALASLSEQQAQQIGEQSQRLSALGTALASAETSVARMTGQLESAQNARQQLQSDLAQSQALSAEAQADVERLSRQISLLREQLDRVAAALQLSEEQLAERNATIEDLNQRLNVALANEVFRLRDYRSEFFGRLKEALADAPNVRIEGDRFILPTELLFASGSAELQQAGRAQVRELADSLKAVSARIPDDIDWILRIDGHTDTRPIATAQYPSNWELSTARAIQIVRLLNDYGIPTERMAATGFGDNHPISQGSTERDHALNRRIEIKLTSR